LNRIYQRDCLEGMAMIPDKSINMILCDLPYGTTDRKWDSIIPFDSLWKQYERIITDKGAVVLTASQPFTSALVMSNVKLFKYEWIWEKSRSVGFLNAKNAPLKKHESVLVFSKGVTANGSERNMHYYPQGLTEINEVRKSIKQEGDTIVGTRPSRNKEYVAKYTGYPTSVIKVNNEQKQVHPTQKPLELFEYLIKTYSVEDDIVLDNCMGSGTTAVAAIRLNRNFIGFERESEYIRIANQRLEAIQDEIAEKKLN
jgi:site-specific DNA-methyltransferase (adenine-specific)